MHVRFGRRVAETHRVGETPCPTATYTSTSPARVSTPTHTSSLPRQFTKTLPPGPGRPSGHRNQHPAPRYDVHMKTPSNQKASESAGPRPRRKG